MYKQFGDAFWHEPQTESTTLTQPMHIKSTNDPWDLDSYLPAAKWFQLNGVHCLFWRDWPLAEPSLFLTPELLHHWHKMFWDHDVKWCIWAVRAAEIDFWFLVLQLHVSFFHFTEEISSLKQITRHKHHDVQCYIMRVVAGAIPRDCLITIQAAMYFQYLCQAEEIDNECCDRIQAALDEVHAHKSAIVDADACVCKGNRPIYNWYIWWCWVLCLIFEPMVPLSSSLLMSQTMPI